MILSDVRHGRYGTPGLTGRSHQGEVRSMSAKPAASAPVANRLRALVIKHRATLADQVGALGVSVSRLSSAGDCQAQISEARALAHHILGASGSLGFDRLCALAAAIERKLGELQDSDQTTDAAKMAEVVALYEELGHAALTMKPEDSRFYFADPGSIVQK
jgi:HPt (histidine-containing phosphotransfer) domain-containing protein